MQKKVFFIILLLAMVLCGCGNTSPSSSLPKSESSLSSEVKSSSTSSKEEPSSSVLSSLNSSSDSSIEPVVSSKSSIDLSSSIKSSIFSSDSSIVSSSSSIISKSDSSLSSEVKSSSTSSKEEPSSSVVSSSSVEKSSSSSEPEKKYYLVFKSSVPSYDIEQGIEFTKYGDEGSFYVYDNFIAGDEVRITDGTTHFYSYDLTTETDNAYFEGLFTVNKLNNIRFNASGVFYIEFDTKAECNNIFVSVESVENSYRLYETNSTVTDYQTLAYKANKTDRSKLTYFKGNQVYSSSRLLSLRFVIRDGDKVTTKVKNISLGPNTPKTFTMSDNQYIGYSGDIKTVYTVYLYVDTSDLSLIVDFVRN